MSEWTIRYPIRSAKTKSLTLCYVVSEILLRAHAFPFKDFVVFGLRRVHRSTENLQVLATLVSRLRPNQPFVSSFQAALATFQSMKTRRRMFGDGTGGSFIYQRVSQGPVSWGWCRQRICKNGLLVIRFALLSRRAHPLARVSSFYQSRLLLSHSGTLSCSTLQRKPASCRHSHLFHARKPAVRVFVPRRFSGFPNHPATSQNVRRPFSR